MESETLRLSLDIIQDSRIKDHRPSDAPQPTEDADPYTAWLKMLLFGAVVAAIAYALSAGWGCLQLSARTRGEPSRRTIGTFLPYIMLSISAFKWMGTWAITSTSPLLEPRSARPKANFLPGLRIGLLRLLVTASFILFSLRVWGLIGEGLRPAFSNNSFGLLTECFEVIETILLWTYLPALAGSIGIDRLRARSAVVMIGRAGAMIGLYIAPFILSTVGHGVTVSWEFGNFRSAVAVFWDAMAMLVLGQFAAALLRNRDAFQT